MPTLRQRDLCKCLEFNGFRRFSGCAAVSDRPISLLPGYLPSTCSGIAPVLLRYHSYVDPIHIRVVPEQYRSNKLVVSL